MQKNLFISLALLVSFFIPEARAALSPVSVAILAPVQFPPQDFSVTGLRLSLLYGRHRDVYGIDVGLVGSHTTQDFAGAALSGAFNWTEGTTHIIGLQGAGVANINTQKTTVVGLQVAAITNYNTAASTVSGLQLAFANYSPFTSVYGVQAGIYNKAQNVYGFQIGLVNFTENLKGLQIGLINFHHKGLFVVSPIINFGF